MSIRQGIGAPLAVVIALAVGTGPATIVPALGNPLDRTSSSSGRDDERSGLRLRTAPGLLLAEAAGGPPSAGTMSFDSRVRRADDLLRGGKAAEAYALLSAVEYEGAGIIEFDYLLGAAAVDSGHADRATLALERVLAQDPYYAGARIELGRAAMALGDDSQAKREFNQVLDLNPPEFARSRVLRYLAEIERREHARRWSWTAYVSASAGRDTNVNVSPSDAFLPYSFIPLAPDNVRRADNVMAGALGGEVRYALNERTEAFVGWDGSLRSNARQSAFDLGSSDAHVGLTRNYGPHALQVSMAGGEFYLDRNVYRRMLGSAVEWRHALGERDRLTPFFQFNELRYPNPSVAALSTHQQTYGLSWLHAFGADAQHVLYAGLFGLSESDMNGNPDGRRRAVGWRLGGQIALRPGLNLLVSLLDIGSSYSKVGSSPQRRGDSRREFTLGLDWGFAPDWSLRPTFTRTEQDSNVKAYDYTRSEALVLLRRDFH